MNYSANTLAIILSTCGVLFFIAVGFSIIPGNYAVFAGVACFILAGMVKRMAALR